MTGNSSSGPMEESHDENFPDQRNTRRQVAYSLMALTAALVVAVFGFVFAYQSIVDSDSSHVHAAESGPHSHEDDTVNDGVMEITSSDEKHEEPAYDDEAGHVPHEEASDEHGHSTNE